MKVVVPSIKAVAVIASISAFLSSGQSAALASARGFQLPPSASTPPIGSTKRNYVFPRGDSISVKVPADWNDNYWHPFGQPFPTIVFWPPPAGQDFQVLLSPLWRRGATPSIIWLRRLVQSMPNAVRAEATESEFPLRHLDSQSVHGFYFSATARTPTPGQFKHLTQGAFKTGALMVVFTILTNDGQEQVVQEALDLMRSAQREIPIVIVRKADRKDTAKKAASEIDSVAPPLIALPGFEGQPEARDRSVPPLFVFRLEKEGQVLRIRWVHKELGQTQAIAVAIQLAQSKVKKQRFELNLIVDGKVRGKKRFKVGEPIMLDARGTPQPYQIRITGLEEDSISGEIAPSDFVGRVEFDFYTADARLIGRSPRFQWMPPPSETEAASADHSASTQEEVYTVVGNGVATPQILHGPLASYTDAAIRAKSEGNVLLQAVIRQDGSVGNIQIIKSMGFYGLDEAAFEVLANKWRFRPGTLHGKPVSVRATIEFTFTLRGSRRR